ncbi:MAG: 4-(cytidine 5'-diphospho)-2-C-methyl-D-erythritol kinase [Lachnospiraceae bacterium]|nr:4-(cytidine 5'-diphospho)-2-C-methyl-D-erythritol kinase [Lachnospiraceae bacterium]
MHLKAYGKINLALDVVGKRDDGYHEVRMVMQTVKIYDGIEIYVTDSGKIEVETNLYFLPVNENNLVYKAAKLLMDEFNIKKGIFIKLQKVIPVAAGMAGGSADAASVLYGVNKLFKLGLTNKELMERGVKLGADIPYCIMRGTALSEGIGEKLTRLPAPPKAAVLVARPAISVSTKFVYENLNLKGLKKHPDIDGMVEAIKNKDLQGIASNMENVLETVTVNNYPIIQDIKSIMKERGAINSLMSGSGPTTFGIYEDKKTAESVKAFLREKGMAKQVFVTEFYNPGK